ncbi:molybdopterin molybdotransferase MoeA [Clostridium malenominatum]|uniref:Molybdopterin molybdenumtransferase n=1 Tax=Clostridium malenominatum TaxID=1539 RepID=A0ABP3UAI1_9CLOT
MDLFNVVSIDETKKIIEENMELKPCCELVDLEESLGRILYEDIKATIDVPGFNRSTVDGYAVYSKDLFGASETLPSMLNFKGEVIMGKEPLGALEFPGDCYYIPTGGMLPHGADSVVMIEYTDKLDDATILASTSVSPGENIVRKGEDITLGEVIIKSGVKLRAYEVGVLSSLGYTKVPVCKKPTIGIISTGDEIVGPDETPLLGQVRDINTYLLFASVKSHGGEPISYGVIRDNYELLKSTMEKALKECDSVLISGGSSVGKKDQTYRVIESLEESKMLIHGIAVKPGKPTIIGKVKNKIIFGLPGHPLSCAVIYNTVVKHMINKALNYEENMFPTPCNFEINYHKAKGREEYLPVTLHWKDGEIMAHPVFGKSGLISGFSKAWGYIKIDKNEEGIKEGQRVYVFKF